MYTYKEANFSDLKGKVLTDVWVNDADNQIIFDTSENERFIMQHVQDCCEYVRIKDICGDLKSLIGNEILYAEESTGTSKSEFDETNYCGSHTWTFYKIKTINEDVTISWLGESNGYYSESVSFFKT